MKYNMNMKYEIKYEYMTKFFELKKKSQHKYFLSHNHLRPVLKLPFWL